MLKNFKDLKVWQKSCLKIIREKIIGSINEIERMLKALIHSLEPSTP